MKIKLPSSGTELVEMLATTYGLKEGAALALLECASQALDTALAAEKLVTKHGIIVEGERGLRQNPACNVSRDARTRLISALGKLNLEL